MTMLRLLALTLTFACVVSLLAALPVAAGPDNYPSYGNKDIEPMATNPEPLGFGGVNPADLPDNYPSYGNK